MREMPDDYPLRVDHRLVEEAVGARVRQLTPRRQRPFHRERERIYETPDPEEREASFRALHGRWFERLGLAAPIHQALRERPSVLSGTEQCRVFLAVSRKEEHADLLVPAAGISGDRSPSLVLQVRTQVFLEPEAFLAFARRELLHVADMLDPEFGYQRRLPDCSQGPSFQNLLLDRYRTLWDTTIDGRLHQEGRGREGARDVRRQDFCRTFRMLGDEVEAMFLRWFDCRRPRHAEMLAFAENPRSARRPAEGWCGYCPVCRMPCAAPGDVRLSPGALREIRDDDPGWRVEQGICRQCADLFEARQTVSAR
ncbi:MAG: hypothetical protein V3S01_13420 [Dehalococcoidia bacterium]